MKNTVTDVTVNRHRGTGPMAYALGWSAGGARFHVWTDAEGVPGDTIYKNPPLGVRRGDAGYFTTRHLDTTTKANQSMLNEVRAQTSEGELFAKADQEVADREANEQASREAAIAAKRVEDAAPDLLVALDGLLTHYVALVASGDAGNWDAETEAEVIAARAAIAKARGTV